MGCKGTTRGISISGSVHPCLAPGDTYRAGAIYHLNYVLGLKVFNLSCLLLLQELQEGQVFVGEGSGGTHHTKKTRRKKQ